MGHQLEIHPLLAIFAVMIGWEIGGLVGIYNFWYRSSRRYARSGTGVSLPVPSGYTHLCWPTPRRMSDRFRRLPTRPSPRVALGVVRDPCLFYPALGPVLVPSPECVKEMLLVSAVHLVFA